MPPWTRHPGEGHLVRVDERFSRVLQPGKQISSSGPFYSTAVPEDLEELYSQELAAMRQLPRLPKNSLKYHESFLRLMQQEEQRRALNETPLFDNLLDKRRLDILHELHIIMSARGYSGATFEYHGDLETNFTVGDRRVKLLIRVKGEHPTIKLGGYNRAALDLPISTPLRASAYLSNKREPSGVWEDGPDGRLEEQVHDLAARTITLGEASYRLSLAEAEDWEAQARAKEAERKREELAKRDAERLKFLHISGDLLRQAYDLRGLIERVRSAAVAGSLEIEDFRLQEWEQWAQAEADRLDPVISGQIMSHLLPKHIG